MRQQTECKVKKFLIHISAPHLPLLLAHTPTFRRRHRLLLPLFHKMEPVLAAPLDLIHRSVRHFKEGLVIKRIHTVDREPHAQGHIHHRIAADQLFCVFPAEFLRTRFRLLYCCMLHERKKFVPADSSHQTFFVKLLCDCLSGIQNHRITDRMSKRIVDLLKIIDINQKHHMRRVRLLRNRLRYRLRDGHLVQKPCQRVKAKFLGQLSVPLFADPFSFILKRFALVNIPCGQKIIGRCVPVRIQPGLYHKPVQIPVASDKAQLHMLRRLPVAAVLHHILKPADILLTDIVGKRPVPCEKVRARIALFPQKCLVDLLKRKSVSSF